MKRKCERETERRKKEWQQRCISTEFFLKNNEWGGGLVTVVFAVELISDQLSSSMCARSECECVLCVGQCLVHKDKTQLYESTAESESESSDQVRDIPSAGVGHDNQTKGDTSIFLFQCFLPLPFKRLSGRTFSSLFYAIEYMRHIGNSMIIQTCHWSVLANVCVVSLTLVRGEIWLVSSW